MQMLAFYTLGPLELIILLIPVVIVAAVLVAIFVRRTSRRANPNLTPCPDCRRSVSVHADRCPHCGRPLVTQAP
jgi:hypothetical protein